ncbi:MAG: hypothetical protein HYT65_03685 [Candidatus Yanofskybacteria bacterium]|nr:hypothetical protein [Candidatus Yanofskybacteria bacterium]
MIFKFLLDAIIAVLFFSAMKLIFWPNIREVIVLNEEAGRGDPDLKKLIKAYIAILKKAIVLIIILLTIAAVMK